MTGSWLRSLLPAWLALTLLAGCAAMPKQLSAPDVGIGPFPAFDGRLIVIEPQRRWQVLIRWDAAQPEHGRLRISHAATGTVVELRWQGSAMQLRDNRAPAWRSIGIELLAEQGIVIPPQTLAMILLGHMPREFRATGVGRWESRAGGRLIRLRWQPDGHRLTMTDIRHGRRATLLIRP